MEIFGNVDAQLFGVARAAGEVVFPRARNLQSPRLSLMLNPAMV